jgi:hypothetical protein
MNSCVHTIAAGRIGAGMGKCIVEICYGIDNLLICDGVGIITDNMKTRE